MPLADRRAWIAPQQAKPAVERAIRGLILSIPSPCFGQVWLAI
jgi:hypothetical protein